MMELFEENKNESETKRNEDMNKENNDSKETTEKKLITYSTDVHIINMLKEILYDTSDNQDCLKDFEEISHKMKIKVKKHPFQYQLPKQVKSYKPEFSKYEESTFVIYFIFNLSLESRYEKETKRIKSCKYFLYRRYIISIEIIRMGWNII